MALLVAAACGHAGPAPDQVLSAAGDATEEASVPASSTTTTAVLSTTVAPTTTTTTKPAPPTTVKRTATTRAPVTATPAIAGYSPAPPPPGVQADGYGGYGGVTTITKAGVSVTLSVYPREQYFGEVVQMGANVEHPADIAITAFTIDFGDGHVVTSPETQNWGCGTARDANEGRWYTYPAPGRYRITVTVTFAACTVLPGPPGSWFGPDGQLAVAMPTGWVANGPIDTVSAGMDMLQRSDRPPRPVGPAPGP